MQRSLFLSPRSILWLSTVCSSVLVRNLSTDVPSLALTSLQELSCYVTAEWSSYTGKVVLSTLAESGESRLCLGLSTSTGLNQGPVCWVNIPKVRGLVFLHFTGPRVRRVDLSLQDNYFLCKLLASKFLNYNLSWLNFFSPQTIHFLGVACLAGLKKLESSFPIECLFSVRVFKNFLHTYLSPLIFQFTICGICVT